MCIHYDEQAESRSRSASVIVGTREGAHLKDLQKPWRRVCKAAGREDVRIHDLRHSWASRALALGESLPMIGRLLGHSQVETTARYAHLASDSAHDAAARIAASIGDDLLGGTAGGDIRRSSLI